jgi:hypothetical protein
MGHKKIQMKDTYKALTGWSTPGEWSAYERGRNDEQNKLICFIDDWDGNRDTRMGEQLHKTFKRLRKYNTDPVKEFISVYCMIFVCSSAILMTLGYMVTLVNFLSAMVGVVIYYFLKYSKR